MHLQHHSSIMLGPPSGYTKHDKLVVLASILGLLPWEGGMDTPEGIVKYSKKSGHPYL